jgi:hypothetical protein
MLKFSFFFNPSQAQEQAPEQGSAHENWMASGSKIYLTKMFLWFEGGCRVIMLWLRK